MLYKYWVSLIVLLEEINLLMENKLRVLVQNIKNKAASLCIPSRFL